MSMANSAESMANSAERRMRLPTLKRLSLAAALSMVLGALSLLVGQLPAGASPSMQATGSSFASVAIQQWVGQSSTLYGLNINWQVTSSVIGLDNFAQNEVDFAASDIPYSSNQASSSPTVPYQYMPDVAGGLAFMYNLTGNDGQQITSLDLDAHVADLIFLGEITYWDDPAIKAINSALAPDLPHTKIVPVYRSDASGENYLLSDYMLHEDASNFNAAQTAFQSAFPGSPDASWPTPSSSVAVGSPPFSTTYPGWAQNNLVGQNGSDNAANYVSALSSNGAITYVETAYAKEHNFPVASLANASGSYVQPTSLDDATALEAAILHADLTQDLSGVYTNPLPNAYPLSAYSYLVTQCSPALGAAQSPATACAANQNATPTFPATKGQALGQFVSYLACGGQEKMALLGYSPLPPNLVREDFAAVGRLPGGVQPPPPAAAELNYTDV
jgi:phosphate transport system substrate-binding protein